MAPGGSPESADGTFTEPEPDRGTSNGGGGNGGSSPGSGGGGGSGGGTDPRFDTCGDANDAGYGDYQRGRDPEYDWYRDSDSDGKVCET